MKTITKLYQGLFNKQFLLKIKTPTLFVSLYDFKTIISNFIKLLIRI